MAAAVGVSGCAASADRAPQSNDDSIIGGVVVTSAALDAVGSLQLQVNGSPAPQHFCTGTLISPTVVLTAKHCALAELAESSPDGKDHYMSEYGAIYFGIGNDSKAPSRLVKTVSAKVAALSTGGIGLGSDVAIYQLEAPVPNVKPLAVARAPLSAADVGQSYVAIGYGIRDAAGSYGARTMGNITMTFRDGKPYQAAYGSYEAFKADLEKQIGRPITADEESEVKEMYEHPLFSDYEAFFASKNGDVQACSGDSGGPLLRKVGDTITVFGVASWVPKKEGEMGLCSLGVTYATFGPSAVELIDGAIGAGSPAAGASSSSGTVSSPPSAAACGGEPVVGRCDGNTVVRCVTENEGGPRTTRTRCDELGLVCGALAGGGAGCLDPQ
jgi:secreted trypsin-like serine protease